MLVAEELGCSHAEALVLANLGAFLAELRGCSATLSLRSHFTPEALGVHCDALLGGDFLRHLQWEAVCVPEAEGSASVERVHTFKSFGEHVVAVQEGLLETLFLKPEHCQDEVAVVDQFGIDLAHLIDGGVRDFAEEVALDADAPGVADGSADDAAQHIAAPLVAGNDAVRDEECHAASVLGDYADCVGVVGVVVALAADALDCGDDGREQVGLIRCVDVLEDSHEAFEAHAGVHAGRGQVGARAVEVVVILHEHEVPEFDIAVADDTVRHDVGAVRGAVILQAAVLCAVVVVKLAAGATGTLVACGSPPVFVVAEAIDLVGWDALCLPQPTSLFVGVVDCGGKLVERDAVAFSHQFNGEIDGVALEVVTEAEVTQHLEEGVVRCVADLFDVWGAEALLRCGGALVGRLRFTGEVGLELHHACGGEQQRGVADWYQR